MIQVLILGGNSCGDEGTKGEELKELKRETKELKRENARVKQEYIECYGRKGFPGSSDVKNLPTCRSPGLGRSPGGGHGNSLQYSCLENSMDRGVWRATVQEVSKSCTQLRDQTANKLKLYFDNSSYLFDCQKCKSFA